MLSSSGFKLSSDGKIVKIMGREHIRNCLRSAILMLESEHSRYSNLDFDLRSILFRKYQPSLLEKASEKLKKLINQLENRVEVQSVQLSQNKDEENTIDVLLTYYYSHFDSTEEFQMSIGANS